MANNLFSAFLGGAGGSTGSGLPGGVRPWARLASLDGHRGSEHVTVVLLSADGSLVLTGARDGTIRTWLRCADPPLSLLDVSASAPRRLGSFGPGMPPLALTSFDELGQHKLPPWRENRDRGRGRVVAGEPGRGRCRCCWEVRARGGGHGGRGGVGGREH